MNGKPASGKPPITIKKYANRRLYNTATSSYITLDHLAQMVRDGQDFIVYDAKTGEDLTRAVLTQIIFEEEGKGQNLLPIGFLRSLISFYGDSLGTLVPRYLDFSMQMFLRNQEQMRKYLAGAFGGFFPFSSFDEMTRQNMAIFERAMTNMFTPFKEATGEAEPGEPAREKEEDAKAGSLESLREQIVRMQRQLDELARRGTAAGEKAAPAPKAAKDSS
ncbi:MAG: polyhydroxyalkanoate synthesis repressor PhaR [Proteobacteria bacterium]|nr:polyhydroxyalkanoate synthesis repressor PhaR [Pseudomonadota bacterium]